MTSPYRPRQVAQMAQEALSRTIFAVSTPPGASNKKHRKVMSVEVRLLRLRSGIKTRILPADDYVVVRRGSGFLLELAGFGRRSRGLGWLLRLCGWRPNSFQKSLFSIFLPLLNGLEASREILVRRLIP